MSIATQDPTLAKTRFYHAVSIQSQAALLQLSKVFFSWLMTQGLKPNLQVVEFDVLTDTDVVIADAPCKLYAIAQSKVTATASFTKGTDSSSANSDANSDFVQKIAGVNNIVVTFYPKGFPLANGFTMQGNTTSGGGTGSGANGASGVVLLGNP